MTRTMTAAELGHSLGEVVESVRKNGDRVVVTVGGNPAAELVPYGSGSASARRRLGEVMERVAARNADVPPDELDAAIAQAIAESRSSRSRR